MTRELPKGCDILIVGAGAYGLSTAWFLSQHVDGSRIVVIDKSDFAGNGTGRCIGGFRTQWGHPSNILMTLESTRFFETAQEVLDYPSGIDLKQEGYLLIAWEEEMMDRFRSVQPAQHKYGVESQLLTADEVLKLSPVVNPEGLVGAAFCGRDGTLSPFRLLDALLTAVRRRGVTVAFGTEVHELTQKGSGFVCHYGEERRIEADKVVLCTDWEVPRLLEKLGVTVPVRNVPVEIMVSEPTRPILGPIHISMKHNMAINQMPRGSIVINHGKLRGTNVPADVHPDWIESAAKGATAVVPSLAEISILRAWAGKISVTPDMQPILDRTGIDNLFMAISAYKGLMTAPAAGRLISDLVLDGLADDDPIFPFVTMDRFASGALVREPMTNGAKIED